jgi:hypothetical protein
MQSNHPVRINVGLDRDRRRSSPTCVKVLSWLLYLSGATVLAGPGELDVRFGNRGWLSLPLIPAAAASLPDGSVVIAGDKLPPAGLVNPQPEVTVIRISAGGTTLWTRKLGEGYTGTLQRLQSGRLLVGLADYYSRRATPLIALLEDGSIDTTFGTQGQVTLDKTQVVTGAGVESTPVTIESIREMADGNLLIGATVIDETIPTPWDPATVAVLFRLSAAGRLLDAPSPALDFLRNSRLAAMELLSGGRGMVLATPWCCASVSPVLVSRDVSGTLGVAPVSADPAWSPTALARDDAHQRFYSLGLQNADPTLMAIRPDGTADSAFGAGGTGRASLAASTAQGRLWVDEGGAVLAVLARPASASQDLAQQVAVRAEVAIEGWTRAGLPDPRIAGDNVASLSGPVGRSTAQVVAVTRADPGFAWIVTTMSSDLPEDGSDVGRLARLQLGAGTGPGAIGFERAAIRIAEQGSSSAVRVIRSGGSTGAVSVRYEILPTVDGLSAASGTLAWADGDASPRIIDLTPREDALLQGERSQSVRLLDVRGGATLASESLTVTIEDDDVLAHLRAGAVAAQIPAGETARFVISLDRAASGPVSITALVGDGVDGAGSPLYLGRNNSGWGRQTVVWNPGQFGERLVTLRTNPVSDPTYAVDLQLRLVTESGWLVRTSPGAVAVGATVKVVGGAASGGSGSSGGGSAQPPPAGSQGGGATGTWSLALLACLLALRTSRLSERTAGWASDLLRYSK